MCLLVRIQIQYNKLIYFTNMFYIKKNPVPELQMLVKNDNTSHISTKNKKILQPCNKMLH